MVKFKVLKEEIKPFVNASHTTLPKEHTDFEIPIQITFEGYEGGLGLGYLENKLILSLNGSRYARRTIRVRSSNEILVGFRKEETYELPIIIKEIEKHLELIIKKHATESEEKAKQREESEEKRRQDLEEVKEKLEKLDFS